MTDDNIIYHLSLLVYFKIMLICCIECYAELIFLNITFASFTKAICTQSFYYMKNIKKDFKIFCLA